MSNERKTVVEDLEKEIAELKRLFELYFRAIEKHAPVDMWEDLKKRVASMRLEAGRWNTVDKFRGNSLYQKFLTYDRMWQREMKAVEEGTSRRDKMKKERMRAQEAEAAHLAGKLEAKRGGGAAAAAAANDDGMSEDKMKRLYSVYMQAKKRTGEQTNLSFEGLKKQIEKQIPVLKQKHNCKEVDFKVVLKDGKALLKAVPK